MTDKKTLIFLIYKDKDFLDKLNEISHKLKLEIFTKTYDNPLNSSNLNKSDFVIVYDEKNLQNSRGLTEEVERLKKKRYHINEDDLKELEDKIRNYIICLQFHEIYCETNFLE